MSKPLKITLALYVLLLVVAVSSISCITQKRCHEKFPPTITSSSDTNKKESVEIKWKDTTIFVKGDEIIIRDYVLCDSLRKAQLALTKIRVGRLTASYQIKDSKLTIDCKEDSLFAVETKLKETITMLETEINNKTTIKEAPIEVWKTHWYDIVARFISSLLLLVIAIHLIIKRFT